MKTNFKLFRSPVFCSVALGIGSTFNLAAAFSDANWISMGGIPGSDDIVTAAAVDGSGNLYIGGVFNIVGDLLVTNIAKWNGTSWAAMPGIGEVFALAASGTSVYAAYLLPEGGAHVVAKWDGASWTSLGPPTSDYVCALAVSGSDLYAGGPTGVSKWNGSSWSALGAGMGPNGGVCALALSGGNLYAGGGFSSAGGMPANNIAKWDGSRWSALGSGLTNPNPAGVAYVHALAVSAATCMRRASLRRQAAGQPITSPSGTVLALAPSGSDLYVAGTFTWVGHMPATNIAKWDGNGWSSLGSGITGAGCGAVYALAVSGSDVYAGGAFTNASGEAANHIAKWNGTNWSALGTGLNGEVLAIVCSGSSLYAGGLFTSAGGSPAHSIAKWNGTDWSPVGSGVDGYVRGLGMLGEDLYVGGDITRATNSGGMAVSVNGIAKWNGTNWSALGLGLDGPAAAFAFSGDSLYAAGWFTSAGGITASNIAKWNGTSWSALGSGTGRSSLGAAVFALAVLGGDLYAGGEFATAGGKVSAHVARAIVNPPVLRLAPDGSGGYFVRFTGVPGSPYRLQNAPTVKGPWASSAPQTAPASGLVEFWDLFPSPNQGFYRTVQP